MLGMRRSARQKVIATAAVAVLLGGASFAAVSATGQGNGHSRARGRHALRGLRPRDLQAAATYLGVSSAQLARELSASDASSRSLAQIAQAHEGKSVQGLIEAIVGARRARLAIASASLPQRVRAEVSRTFTPVAALRGPRTLASVWVASRLGAAAADYLGVTPARLGAQLRTGRSLTQIARDIPGKSKTGLLDALVAAKRQRIAAGVAAGKVTHARGARREQRLRQRVNELLERKFAAIPKP